jgi:hypothetical protein
MGSVAVDVPDLTQTPYIVPVGRKRTRKETKAVPQESSGAFGLPAFSIDPKKLKIALVILLFCLAPVGYFVSASRHAVAREKINTYQYSTIIPLQKAYRVQDNFVGQVKDNWVTLSREEKRRQFTDLVNVTKGEGYQVIALYYPNGQPAANFILGSIIIY